MTEFAVPTAQVGQYCVVSPVGELDLVTAEPLRAALLALLEKGESQIVLDLSGVTFMDSSALGVLISVHRRMPEGSALRLAAVSHTVGRLFSLTRLDSVFPMFDTVQAATA